MSYFVRMNALDGISTGAVSQLHEMHIGPQRLTPANVVSRVTLAQTRRDLLAAGSSSTPAGNKGGPAFEIDDFSFDVEQVLSIGSQSSGAGAGKVNFNPFQITKKADSTNAAIYLHLGKRLPKLDLSFYNSADPVRQQPAFVIQLSGVAVTAVQRVPKTRPKPHPRPSSNHEIERVKFSFRTISISHNGNIKFSDDWH